MNISYQDFLRITGAGTKVKIGYEGRNGWFYEGELKDAPPIYGAAEVISIYVFEGEDVLSIVLKEA